MFAKSVAVVALAFVAAVSGLKIETPSEIKECQDLTINYSEGAPKYLLAIVPGNDPCGNALKEFDETSESKQNYKVVHAAGTVLQFVVTDSSAAEAWSGTVTVKEGDKSCLPKVESAPPVAPPAPSASAPAPVVPAPPKSSSKPSTPAAAAAGVANIEASNSAASSSFVISSAAVAGVIGAAALLL